MKYLEFRMETYIHLCLAPQVLATHAGVGQTIWTTWLFNLLLPFSSLTYCNQKHPTKHQNPHIHTKKFIWYENTWWMKRNGVPLKCTICCRISFDIFVSVCTFLPRWCGYFFFVFLVCFLCVCHKMEQKGKMEKRKKKNTLRHQRPNCRLFDFTEKKSKRQHGKQTKKSIGNIFFFSKNSTEMDKSSSKL